MSNFSKRLFLLVIMMTFGIGALFLSACSAGGTSASDRVQLSFEQKVYEIKIGEELEIIPNVKNANIADISLGWISYNKDVVTVEDGKLTGISIGKTQIKVYSTNDKKISAIVSIRVVNESDQPTVVFEPVRNLLNVGVELQLEYTVSNAESNFVVTFESSNEEVLTVTEEGLIETLSEGYAVVLVKFVDETTGQFASYNFAITVRENYPINYVLDGGTNNEENPLGYMATQDDIILLPATRKGYLFDGWYDNANFDGTQVYKVDTSLKKEVTLYAKWIETTYVVAKEFDVNKTYVFGSEQKNLNKELFMTGKLNGYYGAAVENPFNAALVNIVPVEGGYNIKLTLQDGSIKYADVVANGTHINLVFNNTPTSVWEYNERYNTFTTNLSGTDYYLGMFDYYDTFSPSKISYASTSFVGHLYEEVIYTDEMKVWDTLDSIKLSSQITEDYTLPSVDNVTWKMATTSNYATLEGTTIKVTRPEFEEGDEQITLVATCKINEVEVSLEFDITISKKEQTSGTKNREIVLTVDSLGLPDKKYTSDSSKVDDFTFNWVQLGNYGDGLQMRDKSGNTTTLWNSTAFSSGIVRIELQYSSTKSTYNNSNAVIFSFGNDTGVASYSTKLSTVSGTKTYTITPDSTRYTYFKLEHDFNYTFYWESITIVLAEQVEIETPGGDTGGDSGNVGEEKTYTYTFTGKQFSTNGTKTLNGLSWTLAGNGGYWGYNETRGQQLGSEGNPYKTLTLTSAELNNVKTITINTSGASSINGKLTVSVGGTQVGNVISLTKTATSYTFSASELLSGEVLLSYTQTSSKAIYIKSITIVYHE